jgi:hypothetical protein
MHSRRRNPKVLVAVYNTVSSVHSLSVWRSRKELLYDLDSGASRARVEHQNSSSESHQEVVEEAPSFSLILASSMKGAATASDPGWPQATPPASGRVDLSANHARVHSSDTYPRCSLPSGVKLENSRWHGGVAVASCRVRGRVQPVHGKLHHPNTDRGLRKSHRSLTRAPQDDGWVV